MCEILIRVRDKRDATGYWIRQGGSWVHVNDTGTADDLFIKHATTFKRGDIICVQPDGWKWGTEELTNPIWRIFKLPNVSVSYANSFLASELPEDPQNPPRTLQRRKFRLGLDALTGQPRNYVNDDTRAQPTFTSQFSEAQIENLKVTKPPIADPTVIG